MVSSRIDALGEVIRDNLTHMKPRESQFTGLILVTGVDKPGITQALFETLAPFSITVLDIEQVVIRDRLILTALIRLDPAHAAAIDADLALCASRLNIDIATSFQEEALETIAAKTGLLHVVSLSTSIFPEAVSKIATAIASAGGNIERIHRTASYPITAIEFVVSSADQKRLRTELLSVSADTGVDIAAWWCWHRRRFMPKVAARWAMRARLAALAACSPWPIRKKSRPMCSATMAACRTAA